MSYTLKIPFNKAGFSLIPGIIKLSSPQTVSVDISSENHYKDGYILACHWRTGIVDHFNAILDFNTWREYLRGEFPTSNCKAIAFYAIPFTEAVKLCPTLDHEHVEMCYHNPESMISCPLCDHNFVKRLIRSVQHCPSCKSWFHC